MRNNDEVRALIDRLVATADERRDWHEPPRIAALFREAANVLESLLRRDAREADDPESMIETKCSRCGHEYRDFAPGIQDHGGKAEKFGFATNADTPDFPKP